MSDGHTGEGPTRRIRLLVVDDSTFIRRAIERMASEWEDVDIIGFAADGEAAVSKTTELSPDLVLMDVNMPGMDGLEALRRILEVKPTPVLLMSTLTKSGADVTLNALELGAVDFIDKGSVGGTMDIHGLGAVIHERLRAVAGAGAVQPSSTEAGADLEHESLPPPVFARLGCPFDVVVIGTSTGGPRALGEILPRLPGELGAGLVIAQHMPEGFTETLAARLDRRSALRVAEARDGDRVRPGLALIAPGGRQSVLEREEGDLVVRVRGPTEHGLYLPSADMLFESAARFAGSRAIGVVLTGMGEDGAAGLAAMRRAGARTIVESEETTVIFGMPRAAEKAAEQILPLEGIAPALAGMCREGTDRPTAEE